MTRPRLAVILAAGRGVRLGGLGREIPKGFIPVGGRPLIVPIDGGLARGRHRADPDRHRTSGRAVRDLSTGCDNVELAHNPDYAATGSLSSLMCAGPIDEPYLLVESDLLYEARAPRLLVDAADADVLLASGATDSGDEVYVGVREGRLVDLSKRRDALGGSCVGELVGLTRISPAFHREIVARAKELLARGRPVEYETALVAAGRTRRLSVLVVEDLIWTEIDDERHLARALSVVAPRLDP